ncbi:MAG: hypothetical protein AAF420_11520 [Pseudomonadota bacterium]
MTSMSHQHPQEELLIAYADGRLDDQQRADVEHILAQDSSAREFLELLERSNLPFKEAFDTTLEHRVPDAMQNAIDAAFVARPQRAVGRWYGGLALTATLVLGVVLGYLMSDFTNRQPSEQNPPIWLAQIASYHELYVRETVDAAEQMPREHFASRARQVLGADISVPNLSDNQLEFRRGQVLRIDGKPLVQLAYLPADGAPLALCIVRSANQDRDFYSGVSHNLQFVAWARDGFNIVLVGSLDEQAMKAAATEANRQLL